MKLLTLNFYHLDDLLSDNLIDELDCTESIPGSFGDNCMTLLTIAELVEALEGAMESIDFALIADPSISDSTYNEAEKAVKKLKKLNQKDFVNIENKNKYEEAIA